MKNKVFRHLKKSLIAIFFGLIFSTNTLAAMEDITRLINYLQRVLNASVQSIAESVYEFNPLLPKNIATNLAEPKTQEIANAYSKALVYCQIYNSLPRHRKVSRELPLPDDLKFFSEQFKNSNELCQKINLQVDKTDPLNFKRTLAKIPTSETEKPKTIGPFSMAGGGNPGIFNSNFNFENLIAPTLYDKQARENALGFVAFAGRTYEPFPLDMGTWEQALEEKSTEPAFINYQMLLRSYVTAQSVALSNLYRLIADRSEQPEIAKLKLKNEAGVDIKSPAQYQAYLANRRTTSQEWYTTMSSAPNSTVNREILFVLADIQRSLYRLEQTNERLLATSSVLELINLYANIRPELKTLVPEVESLISGQKAGS